MKAKVHFTLKTGVLDPQGKAVQHALHALGFAGVGEVRQGKFIELETGESDPAKARAAVDQLTCTACTRLTIPGAVVRLHVLYR